jgi:hypothetical protein
MPLGENIQATADGHLLGPLLPVTHRQCDAPAERIRSGSGCASGRR